MAKSSIESALVHLLIFSCIVSLCIPTFIQAKKINISAMIRDSLSLDSIPLVKVMVEELGQSFKTTRSSFYVALPPNTYTFLLEAEDYEKLKKSITISTEGERFVFAMVKTPYRLSLKKRADSLNIYLKAFGAAIGNGDIALAGQYMAILEGYHCSDAIMEGIREVYETRKVGWVDSMLEYANTLEDSGKLSDAYYYYNKVVAFDSLNETALAKIEAIDTRISQKEKGVSKRTSKPAQKSAEEIEEIYASAISKFLAEEYNGALSLLKTVLKYQPTHEGAKNYLVRTKARLKAIGN